MLSLLLTVGLVLSFQAQPAAQAPAETPKSSAPAIPIIKRKHTVAVPEEESKTTEPEAGKPKVAPKLARKPAAPKPISRKPSPPAPSEEQRQLSESQARAAKLINDNAQLQQEMAKAQGISFAEITTPEAALSELQAGNARFIAGKRIRTLLSMQDTDLRAALVKAEAPFAVIVTCSDSRLADDLIFDQELGRLFTIREVGNSPDIQGLASIEYALEHLGSKLVVVLGHTSCGAVKAVQDAHGKPLPGNLWALQAAMAGLLETTPVDPNETNAEYTSRLVAVNAQRQVQAILARSEIVRYLVASGKVKVVPALYDLENGRVKILEMPAAVH